VNKITIAIFSPVNAGLVASLFLYLPDIFPFRLPPEWIKFVSTVPTIATMATGGIVFFGEREKRRTELTEHYKRINENVFKVWSNAVPVLESTAEKLPYSFMPLYTNVISIIKSPGRYHEAKSHLGDSYWNANTILNDLERLEENHNDHC
jgi:hypothetical protein